jgi:hypothetical protein
VLGGYDIVPPWRFLGYASASSIDKCTPSARLAGNRAVADGALARYGRGWAYRAAGSMGVSTKTGISRSVFSW